MDYQKYHKNSECVSLNNFMVLNSLKLQDAIQHIDSIILENNTGQVEDDALCLLQNLDSDLEQLKNNRELGIYYASDISASEKMMDMWYELAKSRLHKLFES